MVAKGRHVILRGEEKPLAKMTEQKVQKVFELRAHHSLAQLAKMFGVSRGTICSIQAGRTWRHVTRPKERNVRR
jgi:DNA-binding XRE family transcriptional regulator